MDLEPGTASDRPLRDSEQRWRGLFERMNEGFFVGELIRDADGRPCDHRYLEINAAFERLTGLSAETTVGRTAREVVPGMGFAATAPYALTIESGRPTEFERFVPELGDRWYEVRAWPTDGDRFAVLFQEITDRKRAEEALRETSRRSEALAAERSAILNQLLEGVIVTDTAGRITFVNEAAVRLHGVGRLDVEPDEYSEVYHLFTDEGRPYPPQELPLARAVLKGETVTEARWRIRRPDGSEVSAIGNAQPLHDADERNIGAVLTIRDDTARAAAERALRESEEQARAVIDGAADYAIFTTDAAGMILDWSVGAERSFGWTEAEAVGRPGATIFTPEDRSAGVDVLEWTTAAQEGCASDERWHLRKDGTRVFMNGSVRPLHAADGSLRGFLKVARDETRQKLATDQVAASEKRFREMADHAPVILWTTDADGVCTYLNQPWYDLTGQTEAEALGLGWVNATHPDDSEAAGTSFLAANAARRAFRVEYRLRTAGGDYRWAIDAGQPRWGADGTYLGMVGAVFDISDRRDAETRVAESEAYLRLLLDSTAEAFYAVDAEGVTTLCNAAFLKILGFEREDQAVGRKLHAVIHHSHPDGSHYAKEDCPIYRCASEGLPAYVDHEHFFRLNGEAVSVEYRASPLLRNGQPNGAICTFVDISERLRTDAALKESEERFRTLADNIPILCWTAYADGHIFWYNHRWYDYTGTDPDSQQGWGWESVHDPERLPEVAARWTRSIATGEPFEMVFPLKGADGVFRPFLTRVVPIRDEDGEIVRWFGTNVDITEERRLAEALEARVVERTVERDRVWGGSSELMAVAGVDGYLKSINPAWTRTLGHDAATLLARPFAELIHPDDLSAAAEVIAALGRGEPVVRFEDRLRAADGGWRWISWTATPGGEVFYAVGRDVTAEREQAEALSQAEEALRQAQKMEAVGQLTGGIAHDFNNLLTGIIGSLDLMKRRIDAGRIGEIERFMDAATTSANRAAALTHRLLAFARRQSLDTKATDVNALVASMEELLHRSLGEQVALTFELQAGLWRATTDANQLESALLNLAINARDAMPDGGQLTVETANTRLDESYTRGHEGVAPGDYVVICVTDTGTGMSAEVIERAFDPFFTTKPIGQGTGLGLSMIYGFARQTGGHARIYSEPGQGTTVKIYMPRARDEGAEAVADGEARETPRGAGETVLVVEDDPAVRLLVLELLAELGYRTLEAHDGPSALPILESDARIDLMISDVGLPGLNGRLLADRAREARPGLKVLFITGYAENAAIRSGFLGAGMQMITKPFAIDALASKARAMLAEG